MICRCLCLLALGLVWACADPSSEGRCQTERDCRPGQLCIDGQCGGAPACALDTDCATGQICRDGACGAQSCRDDDDCPGRRCLERWCLPRASDRCADDVDCASGACGEGGVCLLDLCPPSGCAAGCAGDGDCAADGYCAADGLCRDGCRAGGCPGALCDLETRRCLTVQCAADGDCPSEAYCAADGVCLPGCRLDPDPCPGRCDRATRRCGCAIDDDCPADAFCADDGVCRPGCRVGGCADGVCDLARRACVQPLCARDADCGSDMACGLDDRCHPARGPLPAEAACAQPEQCASGRCVDGLCQGRCAGDADCPSGRCVLVEAHLMCVPPPSPCAAEPDCAAERSCRPWWGDGPPRLGCQPAVGALAGEAPCDMDAQCRGGACVDGVCWAPCAGDADCAGACLPALLRVPRDPLVPDAMRLFAGCLPVSMGSGAVCAADAPCPAGEACGLWPDGTGFEARCRTVAGGGLGGAACALDGDCRGRWCADGRCVAPCLDGACAEGVACVEVPLDDRLGGRPRIRVCGRGDGPPAAEEP